MDGGIVESVRGLDPTGVGIAAGVVGALAYVVVRALRSRSFNIGATITVCVSCFACPTGAVLIWAALRGQMELITSFWRENVAVAGVVSIGIAVQALFAAFRKAWNGRPDDGTD